MHSPATPRPQKPSRKRRICILLAVCGAIAIYTAFCTLTHSMPRCWFHGITGLSCPGCGSQRAVRALLRGQPAEAWSYNLLLPLLVAYLLLIVALPLVRNRTAQKLYGALTSPAAIWSLAAIIIAWWIIRNILNI